MTLCQKTHEILVKKILNYEESLMEWINAGQAYKNQQLSSILAISKHKWKKICIYNIRKINKYLGADFK